MEGFGNMADLTIVIPARQEVFLKNTIEDILTNIEGDTNIIAVLDGYWPDPPITDHPRVVLIHHSESIGQRAASNEGVRVAQSRWVMKLDAHCAFDKGFDVKMLEAFKEVGEDVTMVPTMRNLWAFDWKCYDCGLRTYQGPTPEKCSKCGSTNIKRKMVWQGKNNPQSNSYCFDPEPHFQYFKEFNNRPEGQGDLTETLSLQGSCFMMTRHRYRKLNICDEALGSWGSQGIEVAVKSWLSGGRVLVNHKTWYAHLFRTQKDFGFPYPNPGSSMQNAKKQVKEIFFGNKWEKQVRPLSWLIEKFWPVPGWTDEDLARIKQFDSLENTAK
jgi:glycosyltransferase involved in cell wall biosynthesis